jgi:hypothetical protein
VQAGVAERPFSFHGVGFSLRGEKGRFVLPPSFRKLVKDASAGGRTLCLAKHERWPCLTGFGLSRLDDFYVQLDREETAALARGAEYDRDLRMGQLFGFRRRAVRRVRPLRIPRLSRGTGRSRRRGFLQRQRPVLHHLEPRGADGHGCGLGADAGRVPGFGS